MKIISWDNLNGHFSFGKFIWCVLCINGIWSCFCKFLSNLKMGVWCFVLCYLVYSRIGMQMGWGRRGNGNSISIPTSHGSGISCLKFYCGEKFSSLPTAHQIFFFCNNNITHYHIEGTVISITFTASHVIYESLVWRVKTVNWKIPNTIMIPMTDGCSKINEHSTINEFTQKYTLMKSYHKNV